MSNLPTFNSKNSTTVTSMPGCWDLYNNRMTIVGKIVASFTKYFLKPVDYIVGCTTCQQN